MSDVLIGRIDAARLATTANRMLNVICARMVDATVAVLENGADGATLEALCYDGFVPDDTPENRRLNDLRQLHFDAAELLEWIERVEAVLVQNDVWSKADDSDRS